MKKIKFKAAKAKRKLDRLFSSYILNKYKRICQRCGVSGSKCDTCHLIPRQVTSLRWNEENAICMCCVCHKWSAINAFHQNPLSFAAWYHGNYGVEKANNLLSASILPFDFTQEFYEKKYLELNNTGSSV